MATAILVDGAFFLRRLRYSFPNVDRSDPIAVAGALRWQVFWNLSLRMGPKAVNQLVADQRLLAESDEFYRIFFYDCRPLTKRMHTPIGHKSVDFSKTPEAIFKLKLHQEILKLRKVALRLGRLNDTSKWRLSESATQRLTDNPALFVPADCDFEIDTRQKGVDMRLGLDVASLAFKRQVRSNRTCCRRC